LNEFEACFFVIKSDDQNIRLLNLMLPDAFDFSQDRPYPVAGASGITAGYGHLNDFLSGMDAHTPRCQEKNRQKNTR